MACIGFLPMDFSSPLSDLDSADDVSLESEDDLIHLDEGRTEEEMAGREARIDAFFKAKELERRQWIDQHANES